MYVCMWQMYVCDIQYGLGCHGSRFFKTPNQSDPTKKMASKSSDDISQKKFQKKSSLNFKKSKKSQPFNCRFTFLISLIRGWTMVAHKYRRMLVVQELRVAESIPSWVHAFAPFVTFPKSWFWSAERFWGGDLDTWYWKRESVSIERIGEVYDFFG